MRLLEGDMRLSRPGRRPPSEFTPRSSRLCARRASTSRSGGRGDLTELLPSAPTCLSRWAAVTSAPYIPGKRYIDWNLADPKDKSAEDVRTVRDDIETRVRALVRELDGELAGD